MIQLCADKGLVHFGYYLTTLLCRRRIGKEDINDDLVRVQQQFRQALKKQNELIHIQLLCNWTSSEELMKCWVKMLHPDSMIQFVNRNPHLWVILNAPPDNAQYDTQRTIVFQMEPNMTKDCWGEWASPDPSQFLHVFTHKNSINPLEWHLSKSCRELLTTPITKTEDICISAILSSKYHDEGHRKRVDFVKHIEGTIPVHVFGDNAFEYHNYKGCLPYHQKDDGLFPYKYTFTAENQSIANYCTEKIVDAVLSECLCFYWGCPNLETILDPRCFIRLGLTNMDEDMERVRDAIEQDEWSQRIDVIRAEKKRILTELQFTAKLERMIERK